MTEDLHILCDFDFLQGLAPENEPGGTLKALTVSPGVSSDLFLTSLCLFEREQDFTASVKAALVKKWQRVSGATRPLDIISRLYRSETFSSHYKSKLEAEIASAMNLEVLDAVSTNKFLIQEPAHNLILRYTPPVPVEITQNNP